MVETPTRYKPILKAFKLGGYGITMGASTGQGAGIQWRQKVAPGEAAWNAAVSYVADGNEGASSDSKKGMFGEDTDGLFLSQIGYGNRKWYISGLYAHKQGGEGSDPAEGYSTPAVNMDDAALNAFGIRGLECRTHSMPHHPCCLLYTSPSPRDRTRSRMPSSA